MNIRLLIVGNPEIEHVGAHFLRAATSAGVQADLADSRIAYGANSLIRALLWRIDRIPPRRSKLGDAIKAAFERECFSHTLFCGIAPVAPALLRWVRSRGCRSLCYLTDDPWNKAHRSHWFFEVLSEFDDVITTRRSNRGDLERVCRGRIRYVPFGYDPQLHFPCEGQSPARFDVSFVGNPDRDRLELLRPIFGSNLRFGLFGKGWSSYETESVTFEGYASPADYRLAVADSKVSLLLVRRANRDGHVMRTYELAAQRACIVAERTSEHLEILGSDGECARYFSTGEELLDVVRELVQSDSERQRLARSAYARVTGGHNTYQDRLMQILESDGAVRSFGLVEER